MEASSPEFALGAEPAPEPADVPGVARALFRWARRDVRLPLLPAVERELIVHALTATKGNQAQAARLLGITRARLRKRLERFKIRRELRIH